MTFKLVSFGVEAPKVADGYRFDEGLDLGQALEGRRISRYISAPLSEHKVCLFLSRSASPVLCIFHSDDIESGDH